METKAAFKTKIAKVLTELLSREINPDELNEDTDLIDGIGLNSLDFLQFILKLENEFDIEIDIEKLELHYFKKMGHLREFITQVQEA